MRIALRYALTLLIGASFVLPSFAAQATGSPIEGLAVKNPRKKPNRPAERDKRVKKPRNDDTKRPPRKKREDRDQKEDRESRRKKKERPTPRPDPPDVIIIDPVVIVVDHICQFCDMQHHYCICWIDEPQAAPMSFSSAYAVLATSTSVVNLVLGLDNRSDDFFGVGGLVLGGVGVMAAFVAEDREYRASYLILGLASIGMAVLNLNSDDPEPDPIDISGGRSSSRVAAVSLSF